MSLYGNYCHTNSLTFLGSKTAGHDGKIGFNTVEYSTIFLHYDWLYFLWCGINKGTRRVCTQSTPFYLKTLIAFASKYDRVRSICTTKNISRSFRWLDTVLLKDQTPTSILPVPNSSIPLKVGVYVNLSDILRGLKKG